VLPQEPLCPDWSLEIPHLSFSVLDKLLIHPEGQDVFGMHQPMSVAVSKFSLELQ